MVDTLNSLEGITCNEIQGSMYAFPQIKFPPKVIETAKQHNQSADEFYASEALGNAGICLVPGEGFGQVPGTYHFHTTLLPIEKMKIMLERLGAFHREFMDQYR